MRSSLSGDAMSSYPCGVLEELDNLKRDLHGEREKALAMRSAR